MSFIFIILYAVLSEPAYSYDVATKVLTISGNGRIKQESVRKAGDFKNFLSIVIEEGPTAIEVGAFDECESVVAMYIPSSISQIICQFMRNCYALKSINVASNSSFFENDQYGIIYSKNRLELIRVPPQSGPFQIAP